MTRIQPTWGKQEVECNPQRCAFKVLINKLSTIPYLGPIHTLGATEDSPKKLNRAETPKPARLQPSQPPPPGSHPAVGDDGRAVAGKDTEAPVGDGQVPEVDAQVVRGHVRLAVAVDGNGVDVVGVAVGKDPARTHLHH